MSLFDEIQFEESINHPIDRADNVTARYYTIDGDKLSDHFDRESWLNVFSFYFSRLNPMVSALEKDAMGLAKKSLSNGIYSLKLSVILRQYHLDVWHYALTDLDFSVYSNIRIYYNRYGYELKNACIASLINSGIVFNQDGKVVIASAINPSVTQSVRDELSKVSVRYGGKSQSFLRQVESRLADKKYRRSTMIKHNNRKGERQDEKMGHSELWMKGDLQIRITPYGYKKDSILACLWFRFLPSTEWNKLGVLKLAKQNKIFFSALEMNFIILELRVRVYALLKLYGLTPNEVVKNSNCQEKTDAILACQDLQNKLNIQVLKGANPTLPYTLLKDDRQIKPQEKPEFVATVEIRKFVQIGTQADLEIKRLQKRAISSESALKRATRDISKLESEREDRLYPAKLQTARIKATHNLVDRL